MVLEQEFLGFNLLHVKGKWYIKWINSLSPNNLSFWKNHNLTVFINWTNLLLISHVVIVLELGLLSVILMAWVFVGRSSKLSIVDSLQNLKLLGAIDSIKFARDIGIVILFLDVQMKIYLACYKKIVFQGLFMPWTLRLWVIFLWSASVLTLSGCSSRD